MIDLDVSTLVYTVYSADIPRFRDLLSSGLESEKIAFASSPEEATPHLQYARVLYGWGFPSRMMESMPNLQWIQKMGAGVDDLAGAKWPFGSSVLLTRTDGRLIAPRMVEYVTWATLRRALGVEKLHALRARNRWEYVELGSIRQHVIGIAGLGEIGTEVASALRNLGAEVIGWRRTPTQCDVVSKVFVGLGEFGQFLTRCSVVVILLPRTNETLGLFNASALSRVKDGCHLINVSRGGIVDEDALIAALDQGQLSHATLDVVATEPLPSAHPLWTHPSVTLTPHVSGPLIPEDVVPHFIENFLAFRAGNPLRNVVIPERQY
jgi:glyoxylate/hydroxypyruvate reductase